MGVSRLTALTIGTNYPDNIKVAAGIDEGLKWAGFIYLMRDGKIHALQISTQNVFDTSEEAEANMHELCVEMVEYCKPEEKI